MMKQITADTKVRDLSDVLLRTRNSLENFANCRTVRDIVRLSEKEIRKLPNVGTYGADRLIQCLSSSGFKLFNGKAAMLDSRLEHIGLNTRALNPLFAGGYRTVRDVLSVRSEELLKCPNLGNHWLQDIEMTMLTHGFRLGEMVGSKATLVADTPEISSLPVSVSFNGVSVQGDFLVTGLKPGQSLTINFTVEEKHGQSLG